MRTLPASARVAAMLRVRQKRACQSHLSRRSSPGLAGASLKLANSSPAKLEIAERGEGRIAGLLRGPLAGPAFGRPQLLLRPRMEAQLAILLDRAEAERGDH